MITVIVPTYDRSAYLKDALFSILQQDFPTEQYEIIVVDNKPTDEVRQIIQYLEQKWQKPIRYIEEPNAGLHNARHAGAKAARGDILVYVDDDVIAAPGWLKAIKKAFDDTSVVLVGGKIHPKCEGNMPEWIKTFKKPVPGYGWTLGYLSLLDFGDETREIPAYYVYGCNFSIRKSILFECGGFHPDGMPQELIQFRGDGETALSRAIMKKKYKSVYEPGVFICHRIPTERLTADYFCRRAFNQGISDSYTAMRNEHELAQTTQLNYEIILSFWKAYKLKNHKRQLRFFFKRYKKLLRTSISWKNIIVSNKTADYQHPIIKQTLDAYKRGKSYHQRQVMKNVELFKYVLKKKYF